MTLEACLICIDNSEHMRNGDFLPTRFEAQHDAVNLITGAKTQMHPENGVGVLAMASQSNRVEVLVNLTADFGTILTNLHKARIGGTINLSASLNVARLALKHRQNRNQHQRIIAFVGSPVTETVEELASLGKKLKKNNVALDIVNFGEETENTEKLEALVNAADRDGNSHLVTVPPGPHILSDILVSSAIVRGADGLNEGGGTDMDMDDELAMVLRLSMEEHEREQQRRQQETSGIIAAPSAEQQPVDQMLVDEDEEMRLAIEMSLAEANQENAASTQEQPQIPQASGSSTSADYVASVLQSLPGVDSSDPRIQDALRQIGESEDTTMKDASSSDVKDDKKDSSDNK